MSRFLLRYGLVLTVAWLLLMVAARALGGSVGGQEWILYLAVRGWSELRLLDPSRSIALSLENQVVGETIRLSPDGQYIAYTVNMPDSQHCVVRDLYASALIRYRSPTALTCNLYWSYDGKRILFSFTELDNWTLVRLGVKTDEQQQIQGDLSGNRWLSVFGDVGSPTVTFQIEGAERNPPIMQANLETGQIWEHEILGEIALDIPSPDGRWLIYLISLPNRTFFYLQDAKTGEWSLVDNEPLTNVMDYRWFGSRFYYRPFGYYQPIIRLYDPLTKHLDDVDVSMNWSILLAPDGEHLVTFEDGMKIQRWQESDQQWEVLYQQPQQPGEVNWIDEQTLAINETRQGQSILWIYDTETRSRWEVGASEETLVPLYWSIGRDHFVLKVTTSNARIAILAVNRATNAITTLIPPTHRLNEVHSPTPSSIRLFDASLSGTTPPMLQLRLDDLRVQPVVASVRGFRMPIFQTYGIHPNAIVGRASADGYYDLYLLDTQHAEMTPLPVTADMRVNRAFWVYPAPPREGVE